MHETLKGNPFAFFPSVLNFYKLEHYQKSQYCSYKLLKVIQK